MLGKGYHTPLNKPNSWLLNWRWAECRLVSKTQSSTVWFALQRAASGIFHHFSFFPPSSNAAPRALPSICWLAPSCNGDGFGQTDVQILYHVLQYWNAHNWNGQAWKHLSNLLMSLCMHAGTYRHKSHLYPSFMNKWSSSCKSIHCYVHIRVYRCGYPCTTDVQQRSEADLRLYQSLAHDI